MKNYWQSEGDGVGRDDTLGLCEDAIQSTVGKETDTVFGVGIVQFVLCLVALDRTFS